MEYGIIIKGSNRFWLRQVNPDSSALYYQKQDAQAARDDINFSGNVIAYVCAYENYDQHVRDIPGEVLERRLTSKYVGTWKHLDEHEYIGRLWIQATSALDVDDDPEDPCDPHVTVLFVKVFSGKDEEAVKSALCDHFTAWGCSHEYDCCGCRSYRAGKILRLGSGYWRVTQHSSRNY